MECSLVGVYCLLYLPELYILHTPYMTYFTYEFTENQGPLVQIDVFPEMKLRGLIISKTEL
jgi:hypothetical protein